MINTVSIILHDGTGAGVCYYNIKDQSNKTVEKLFVYAYMGSRIPCLDLLYCL